jgi:hydroxymethylglutaryl-CoA lyase
VKSSLLGDIPKRVTIVEVGPRDGLQNESGILSTDVKLGFIQRLVDAGLRTIEVTSFVNPRWIPALADATELASQLPRIEGVRYAALVPNKQGYERFRQTPLDFPAVFMSASQTHNKKNINKTMEETYPILEEVVALAKADGKPVRGYVSTVFGCPYEGAVDPRNVLTVIQKMLGWGVSELSLGDTIGVANPKQVLDVLRMVLDAGVPVSKIALHFHDTRGLAIANYLAGLEMGVSIFDSSVGGLGGCPYAPGAAGNAASEDLVFMLEGMGIDTGINLAKLAEAGGYIGRALGKRLPGKYQQSFQATAEKKHT